MRTESQIEIKVKGSRFIGETCLVASVDEAVARLAVVRKREYQATHHCYAYVTGWPDQVGFKYSDDGEPSGTAGRPIYDVITGHALTNLLVVVTRYFGGTKLGTGGLVRAYSEAARAAVEASGRHQQFLTRDYRFVLEFARYDQW
ncbi:MAG: YigZ family protein, partial [candidate division Zixibacteria bacterium]|nr:YigZ family protein [candidate division Zixibacteria bacterium]